MSASQGRITAYHGNCCDPADREAHFERWRASTGRANLGTKMSKLLRGAVAGAGAWKLGGGLIGTILLFILLWVVLGNFDIFK